MAEGGVPRAQFTAFIGGVVEEVREGYCRLGLVAGPQHLDRDGALHAGVLTTLLDSSLGIALGGLRGRSGGPRSQATIEMSAGFPGRAQSGDKIVVEGRVTHLLETVAFGRAEARRDRDGEVIAEARLTFAVRHARP
ncbi:MAG: PaaI family thioesterase [Dehalococcoidia bacterium]|nr:PaaI family thioesterase [Dehalococcoidia bacterium]